MKVKPTIELGDIELFPGNFKFPVTIPMNLTTQDEARVYSTADALLFLYFTVTYNAGFGSKEKSIFTFYYLPPPKDRWIPLGKVTQKIPN